MRTAAIGIGSNSLRMLVADVDGGKLRRVKRYREGLRVFAALDENGNIRHEMIDNACQSVSAFIGAARADGAETVHVFATSAVRDARNQAAFAAAIGEVCGQPLDICSGETEARLSYIGATCGKPAGLIDIGGGSTEIALGDGFQPFVAESLQMGAVRLKGLQPIENLSQVRCAVQCVREILLPYREEFLAHGVQSWVGVGGTFTTTASLVKNIPWDRREGIHGFLLHRQAVEDVMTALAPMPMSQRLTLPGLQPQRADIVVHGIAILVACMETLSIDSITVSEYGNLEGYIKMKYLLA